MEPDPSTWLQTTVVSSSTKGTAVQIPKDKILDMIRGRGNSEQAGQAEAELPDQVDTGRDQGLLAKFGIDPGDLIGGLSNKFGA